MQGLEDIVRCYLDDLLIINRTTFEDHLEQLEKVLQRLQRAGLKVNAEKSKFFANQIEYLGFWLTRDGISPLESKVEAIKRIEPPKTQRQLRRFIGMLNFYRDMWRHRSHMIAPLTELTGKNAKKFKWEQRHQLAFEAIKTSLERDVKLAYPDFSKPFEIYTDASDYQLGATIMQEGKPIAFYSRKLTDTQRKYTTTERELLSIVETLREYRNILLGYEVIVYTDHLNLTYENFTSNRVHRWRLLIEEFGPDIRYIKGAANVVADALSRLDIGKPVEETEGREGKARATKRSKVARTDEVPLEKVMVIQTLKNRKLSEKAKARLDEKHAHESREHSKPNENKRRERKRSMVDQESSQDKKLLSITP